MANIDAEDFDRFGETSMWDAKFNAEISPYAFILPTLSAYDTVEETSALCDANWNAQRRRVIAMCFCFRDVTSVDPDTLEQIGFHLSRNSLWIARITCARVNNRVTRFRRFPAINGDRLGLTDRLIQSQTSVDVRLCRFTFQLSGGQSRWHGDAP